MVNAFSLTPFKELLEEIWETKTGSQDGFDTAWGELQSQDASDGLDFFAELEAFNDLVTNYGEPADSITPPTEQPDTFEFNKEPFKTYSEGKNYLDSNFTQEESTGKSGTKVTEYTDDNGNVTATVREHETGQRAIDTTEYDENGNKINETSAFYDSNGNLYRFNQTNVISSEQDDDGNTVTTSEEIKHNADGTTTASTHVNTVNEKTNPPQGLKSETTYSDGRTTTTVNEYDENGKLDKKIVTYIEGDKKTVSEHTNFTEEAGIFTQTNVSVYNENTLTEQYRSVPIQNEEGKIIALDKTVTYPEQQETVRVDLSV